MKYLLSTGKSTEKIEKYIVDLFKLNFAIYPSDIPNCSVGFDYIFTDTKKDEVMSTIKSRINNLLKRIQKQFTGVTISIDSIEVVDSKKVRMTITVNDYSSTDIYNYE